MSIIAAGTTTTTALSSTGNTDGTLQFQVNGTTASVTLNTLGAIGVGSSPSFGTSGQVLVSAGSTAAPAWATPAAVNLATGVTGTLPITNGGTGTTSTTFANLTTNVTGTLPIANGGTNSTATPTAGTVPYGTGTAFAFTSAGTSGQLLQSNGASAPTWVTPSGGGFSNIAVLTSGTSWTAPAGVTKIKVTVTGGGGGGGGTSSSLGRAGGGGAAGGTAIKIFTVVPATSYTYSIGAAGTAGTSGGGAGGTGGNSTFIVSPTTVTGGGGGGGAGGNTGSISGGTGGTATNGDMNIVGGGGGGGAPGAGYEQTPSGKGGGSFWGGGAPSGASSTGTFAGVTATTYGTGGSGASSNNTSGAGGAGFQGVILIEY